MATLKNISTVLVLILNLAAVLALFVKPIREFLFNTKKASAGEKCLLRSEMLRIYYKNINSQTIKQYEMENYIYLYEAYKALGGNSFIDQINEEIHEWKVIK